MMFNYMAPFRNREDAGHQLARRLMHYRDSNPLLLALPRGGVPVAFEVVKALHAPLDLLIVRKIGAPSNLELGLGAVVDGSPPHVVRNPDIIRLVQPPHGYFEAETQRQVREIERRRQTYLNGRQPMSVQGRTVIVIDDGIATGSTARAALQALRQMGAKHIVLAVPVAPLDMLDSLRREADDLVCLSAPYPFNAVGQHYANFPQTSDEEVIQLLREARAFTSDDHIV
jgi:putative phosphoribosyl transferase